MEVINKIPAGMEICSRCDGDGNTGYEEESGMPFTCFACCETGFVPIGGNDPEPIIAVEGPDYEARVQAFEAMGLTRSDAQGVVDAEDMQRADGRGFQVKIIDCERAGLIGGPFMVVVLKGGRMIASTSGIRGPTGANGVARNYASTYGVQAPEVTV